VAYGHLGIWSALGEVFPDGAEQRCWNHRLTNVIDHLPKKEWSGAKELLRKIPYAQAERNASGCAIGLPPVIGNSAPKRSRR
jgi:putative transposase